MFKKIVALISALILFCLPIVGCSSQDQSQSSTPDYKDQAFLTDFGKALEARWELTNNSDNDTSLQDMKTYIQAELDILSPYSSASFEDNKLHELALGYINSLNGQMENVQYYNASDSDAYSKWEKAYNERAKLINDILNSYDIPINDKYQDIVDDLKSAGSIASEKEVTDDAAKQIADSIKIQFSKDEYGSIEGKTKIKNTSKFNFEYIFFDVQLYDKNGERTSSTSISVDNWKSGETVNENVYVEGKSAPTSYKVVVDSYSIEN